MPNPYILWKNSQGEDERYELGDGEVTVGRLSESDIVIMNPYVSRRHLRISPRGSDYLAADLNSTHGTFVNGTRIVEQKLNDGDCITLGRDQVRIEFHSGERIPLQQGTMLSMDLQKSVLQLTSVIPLANTEASYLEKISHILDFQYHWEKSFSSDQTFRQILDSALQLSGAERGYILLKAVPDFKYVLGLNGSGQLLPEQEFRTSRTVVQQVVSGGQPVVMTHNLDKVFAQQQSILAMDLRAVACMPLKWISRDSDQPEVRGILYLDSTKAMHALSGLDQKILNRLADEAANVFEKLELLQAVEERKVYEKELALAKETQKTLLPAVLPTVEGFELAAFSQPTRFVGGDFYDFLPRRTDFLTGVLADVSGKGVSAALLSSLVQGALMVEARSGAPIEELARKVNLCLCERSSSNRFVTLFLFSVDKNGQGHYLSAGHNPTYVYRVSTGQIEELPAHDLILGAFTFATYSAHPLELNQGDVLVIYSDGITEAMNPRDDMFGDERLKDLIRENAGQGCKTLERTILTAIQQFTEGRDQTDDMTMVIVQRPTC